MSHPTPAPEAMTFGCVPHVASDRAQETLLRLAEHLGRALGIPVEASAASSPAALAASFLAGEIDLAWVSAALVLTHPGMAHAQPILSSVREGVSVYHGVLFVARDSPIRSPADLGGKTAAWVAPTSAAGCIFPRLTLATYGFDPQSLFADERYLDSHGNVARAILEGSADVGGTFAVFKDGDPTKALLRGGFDEIGAGKAMRIILATDAIPADLIVVRRGLDAAWVERVQQTLRFLTASDETASVVAEIFHVDHFSRFEPSALDALREQIEHGRALGLLD